ncbi:ATP-binding protein [Caballeronia sp. LZ035]|uniref:ATP-binding protein n=1 Tax=Caballeronia sp. LZ035 TaxID=3038568 RepID=UPI0028626E82|nr:ATP-binding protein [Caballeronia sp. LZ035]MDR5762746.1 ATP-binding protein [Caballeronia sp. LZ035]
MTTPTTHTKAAKKTFGLTAKLFVAMLAVNIVLIGAMSIGARISFQRGFLGYLTQQDQKRLDDSVAPLANAYQQHGNWDFIRQDRHLWHMLMLPSGRSFTPSPDNAPFPVPPLADLIGANLRFTLVDANHVYLAGNRRMFDGAPRKPVVVEGKTVGWLLIAPVQDVMEPGDLRLQETQREASWVLAVAATLIAVLISLWIARSLGLPLQRIARATHVLARGEFNERVPVVSGGELGQLEADFNNLAETLERNEQMRAALVADVSHELRTPLAVMRAEVEALEVGVREMNVDAMRSLSLELERLSRLTDDLYHLSLSDVGALQYHFGDVDVSDALDEILRLFGRRLADAGITLETRLPDAAPLVYGDERRLQQVFSNILQNVVRYVPAGATLSVGVRAEGGRVHVDFQDSGPGVPEASLAVLFERFYRVESSRSRATGGAGLGLPICRSIVQAHDGRISAAKAPQGGLWIAIVLPRQSEDS